MIKRLLLVLACLALPVGIILSAAESWFGLVLLFLCMYTLWKLHFSKSDLSVELTKKE
ncbi:MAG: hypothetical protein PHT40_00860 [Patescibacteria group bacterium]|nr:hypothetical protein [Patescibacteria group bacterium]